MLICGDKYPIISNLKYSGLIGVLTNVNSKDIIHRLKLILDEDRYFFQYILKILPIDILAETSINTISKIIKKNYRNYIKEEDTFKIELNRRKSDLIGREEFITSIAEIIDNKVNLNVPDVIVRFEILGRICGISFLRSADIIEIPHRFQSV